MQQELNKAREALAAEKEAHDALKDMLAIKERQLTRANEANEYINQKTKEHTSGAAAQTTQLKKDHDHRIAALKGQHASEIGEANDQKGRLRVTIEGLEKMLEESQAARQKAVHHNEQQKHNLENMRLRLRILEQAQPQALDSTLSSSTTGQKRGAHHLDESRLPNKDIPRHKKPKNTKVACTQCFTHGWKDCDGEAPCENCILRGKPGCCKRVMCKYYFKDTCSNQSCTLAHEDDSYTKLVPFTRLQTIHSGSSPLEMKTKKDAAARQKAGNEKEMDETPHDALFENILEKLKKRSDRGDDSSVV